MDLTLIASIADRLISLLKRREEVSLLYFEHFATPLVQDIEKLHDDYIKRFEKYRELIANTIHPLNERHPAYLLMNTDEIYGNARERRISESYRLDFESSPARNLYIAAMRYVYADSVAIFKLESGANCRFHIGPGQQPTTRFVPDEFDRLVLGGSTLSSEEMRDQMIRVLDASARDLQNRYSQVVGEYNDLKRQMIRPR